MLKLPFEKVLDYVRDGESDPFVKEMLERDPDGPDMLRQARLMFDVLGKGPVSDDDIVAMTAVADTAPDPLEWSEEQVEDLATAEYPQDLFNDKFSRVSEKQIAGLSQLVRRASGSISKLGELRIVHGPDQVSLSYGPDPANVTHRRKDRGLAANSMKTMRASAAHGLRSNNETAADVVISGSGLELTLSEAAGPEDALSIRITNTKLQIPARALEIIFMPESGSFERAVTDSRGVARLPMPAVSGTLRIEADTRAILGIQVKKLPVFF